MPWAITEWLKEFWSCLGEVIHAYNPSTLGGRGGRIKRSRSRQSWPTWWNPISTKNTKISWEWWQAPVVSATREVQTGESLETRRWALQWAKIVPLHSSLATEPEQDSISKKKIHAPLNDITLYNGPPGRLEQADCLSPGVQDQPRRHGKTPSYENYKNQLGVVACARNVSYLGDWGGKITWTQEAEATVRQDHATVAQPGRQSKTPSQNK